MVRDETDRERTVNVVCAPPKGEIVQQLGLPPVPVEFESKTLENNVGYLRFNIFLLPNLQKLRAAAEEMGGAKGIVLDLRGNPGGLLPITYSIAGILSPKSGNLGTMRQRNGTLRFPFTPQEPRYAGPLAILTDELSLSCSEVLAGGLQELGRAKIVGRRTGGMVLPAQIKILPAADAWSMPSQTSNPERRSARRARRDPRHSREPHAQASSRKLRPGHCGGSKMDRKQGVGSPTRTSASGSLRLECRSRVQVAERHPGASPRDADVRVGESER